MNFAILPPPARGQSGGRQGRRLRQGVGGEAYFGHFFWDTEIYLLPFYLYTRPKAARALMEFRLNTLAGAERNAALYGYRGARFPWESSVTGRRAMPHYWQYADFEIHVTADVVHALRHYAAATGGHATWPRGGPSRADLPVLAEQGRAERRTARST